MGRSINRTGWLAGGSPTAIRRGMAAWIGSEGGVILALPNLIASPAGPAKPSATGRPTAATAWAPPEHRTFRRLTPSIGFASGGTLRSPPRSPHTFSNLKSSSSEEPDVIHSQRNRIAGTKRRKRHNHERLLTQTQERRGAPAFHKKTQDNGHKQICQRER